MRNFPDPKRRPRAPVALLAILLVGAGLSGCAAYLPKAKADSVKILKDAIHAEFAGLTREFDRLDQKGDLELCAPVRFGIARFAVYQAVEEKRGASMAQLARFMRRARTAIQHAQERMQKKQCVDSDGDSLTDIAEHRKHHTKPDDADTDGDNLSDSLEIRRYRTDPLRADSDGDLLSDGEEIARKLNPLLADSDGDGFIDGIEVAHDADARDACSRPMDAQRLKGPWRECQPKRARASDRRRARTPRKRNRPQAQKAQQARDHGARRQAQKPKARARPARPPAKLASKPKRVDAARKKPEIARKRGNPPTPPQTRDQRGRAAAPLRQATPGDPARGADAGRVRPSPPVQAPARKTADAQQRAKANPPPAQPPASRVSPTRPNPERTGTPAAAPPRVSPPVRKKPGAQERSPFPSVIFLRVW